MRIITKYKDYYDYVQGMGQDSSIVYNRKPTNSYNEMFRYCKSTKTEKDVEIHKIKVYVNGMVYNIYGKSNWNAKTYKWEYEYYNDKETVISKYGNEKMYSLSIFSDIDRTDIFDMKRFNQKVYDFQKEINAPVIISGMECEFDYNTKLFSGRVKISNDSKDLIINPCCLGEIGFYNIMSGETIFTVISNFFLSNGDKGMVEISDKSKLQKAGFDDKISFRKRKV